MYLDCSDRVTSKASVFHFACYTYRLLAFVLLKSVLNLSFICKLVILVTKTYMCPPFKVFKLRYFIEELSKGYASIFSRKKLIFHGKNYTSARKKLCKWGSDFTFDHFYNGGSKKPIYCCRFVIHTGCPLLCFIKLVSNSYH